MELLPLRLMMRILILQIRSEISGKAVKFLLFLYLLSPLRPAVPWFLACNRRRYPYWFGEPDPRNQDLLEALNKKHVPLSEEEREKMFPYIPTNMPVEWKRDLMRLFFTPADQNGNIILPNIKL